MSIASEAIWAALPSTTRGQPTPLSSDSKGERIAYASGKSIFTRSIPSPNTSTAYTLHTAPTTVARFSPSGFWIASADASGQVRVWSTSSDGTTKGEYAILAGRINDLAWDADNQRIIAVGSGRERMGHAFSWDTGNSVGEVAGHSGPINAVSIRQQRPLRAATGSDDASTVFYHGAPFKFQTSMRGQHERFVLGTAFSPDGTHLVTVGADRKIWLYDGKTGEPAKQIGEGVHGGSIFAVSWAPDSRRFATSSADGTVRVWDADAGTNTHTWRLAPQGDKIPISEQQVGLTWPGGRNDGLVISIDLDGRLNYLYPDSDSPARVVDGHQKSITAALVHDGKVWTGSYAGAVRVWDAEGVARRVEGTGHSNYVSGFAGVDGGVVSVGWDDTLRRIEGGKFVGEGVKIGAQPKGVAAAGGRVYVLTAQTIVIVQGDKVEGKVDVPGDGTAISVHEDILAVGSADKKVRIYSLASGKPVLTEAAPRSATGAISALAFSPQGGYLAAGVANGKILVYRTADWSVATDRWGAHTGRVTALAWEGEERCVSGALDTNVFVWSVKEPAKRVKAGQAHKEGVNGVGWLDSGRVVSAGGDAAVRVWGVGK
ncbi:WD40 repeat-like protein [Trichodelitschia bisporula]|uniref:WD40 repeat-like protein n=1 Tax=Trichodelitschia bisporula TaxID=703511 RepID=A0A6G1I226_9PEZI|nr:WD40 repeat-like protein [Trichodelitschia bisporula]